MFAYCNNNPAVFYDCNGKDPSPAVSVTVEGETFVVSALGYYILITPSVTYTSDPDATVTVSVSSGTSLYKPSIDVVINDESYHFACSMSVTDGYTKGAWSSSKYSIVVPIGSNDPAEFYVQKGISENVTLSIKFERKDKNIFEKLFDWVLVGAALLGSAAGGYAREHSRTANLY